MEDEEVGGERRERRINTLSHWPHTTKPIDDYYYRDTYENYLLEENFWS